jgi:hypothetical protein
MRKLVVVFLALSIAFALQAIAGAEPTPQDKSEALVAHAGTARAIASADGSSPEGTRSLQSSSGCYPDASGDVMRMSDGIWVSYPKADITEWCGEYGTSTITMRLTLAQPTDPSTDTNWIYGITGIMWSLDVNNDGHEDYDLMYINDTQKVVAGVVNSSGHEVCTASPTYSGGVYIASFAASCIGGPAQFHARAFFVYDDGQDAYADVAPDDFGFRGPFSRPLREEPQPEPAPEPQPISSVDHFDDIANSPHRDNINFLAARGYVRGCAERRYCPNDSLTRAQFATVLANFIRDYESG